MISLNCTKTDEMMLHRKMMALARRSLAGKATIRSNQDGEHMIKKPEREILKMLRIGTFSVELNIARLQFWQRIFRAPDYHQQVITAMFENFHLTKMVKISGSIQDLLNYKKDWISCNTMTA